MTGSHAGDASQVSNTSYVGRHATNREIREADVMPAVNIPASSDNR